MASTVTAAESGDFTGDNYTDSFKIQNSDFNSSLNVNTFAENIQNISVNYIDNQSQTRSFNINVSGNASGLVNTPDTVTLFNNESNSFPVIADISRDQRPGNYNGSISLTGADNKNFTGEISFNLTADDDISPSIVESNVSGVEATDEVEWGLKVNDNINVSTVEGRVLREETVNGSVTGNVSVENFGFKKDDDNSYSYLFKETGVVGNYFLEVNVSDSTGNTVSEVFGFSVDGLESIKVKDSNFVFETFQAKDSQKYKLIDSSKDGKKFSIVLENLSFGGNESLKVGVVPPNGSSPEILGVGESRSYSESGVYVLEAVHTGSNELEGVHDFNGELKVVKPGQHVQPRNVSVVFGGSVKNLDKPAETCTRVAEFNGCIGYSLDSVKSLFNSNYGINGSGSRDYAYLLGRVPISDVEGSSEWGSELSLSMGEYNKTVNENKRLESELDRKVNPLWRTMFFFLLMVSSTVVVFVYKVYPTFEFDSSTFRERSIKDVKTSEEKTDSLMDLDFSTDGD